MIETALISTLSRANDLIFGRTVLERLLIHCERAGINRFVIEVPPNLRDHARQALGRFRNRSSIGFVDSLDQATRELDPTTRCVRFVGNLVLAQSQLRKALDLYDKTPGATLKVASNDPEHGGVIAMGPLRDLLGDLGSNGNVTRMLAMTGALPFALNGRPEDSAEAEVRLASSIRRESLATDALMARVFDRRLSWRISLPLARRGIAPNVVTLANTALGFGCAVMLASVSYWIRLAGALLFLLSITIDGVDGEVARLRMVESKFGGQLDVLTDNLVHVGIFIGLMVGCYRVSHSSAYFYLLGVMCLGFLFCAVSVNRALGLPGVDASRWISRVERATGRDFAYLVVILAIIDRLSWFAWTAALGTYVFALVLWVLTSRQMRHADKLTLPDVAPGQEHS